MNERKLIKLMLLETGCLEQLAKGKPRKYKKPVYRKRNCLRCKKEFSSDGNRLCNVCHSVVSYISVKDVSRSEKWYKKRRKNAQYTNFDK